MNTDQVQSLIRTVLKFVGGLLVAHGITTDSMMQDVIGALMTLAGAAWSFLDHKDEPKPAPTTTP